MIPTNSATVDDPRFADVQRTLRQELRDHLTTTQSRWINAAGELQPAAAVADTRTVLRFPGWRSTPETGLDGMLA